MKKPLQPKRFFSCGLVGLADLVSVRVIINALHKLRIDVALSFYGHADALVVEYPDVVFPDSGVFLPENGAFVYTAELCPPLGRVEQVALSGIEELITVMLAVLLFDLLFYIF